MKIVYNPPDGAPISGFVFAGTSFNTHYPEGYELQNKEIANGLAQYEDLVANALIETYAFLQVISNEQALEMASREKKEDKLKCDHPGCEFETTAKIALISHKKKHEKEEKPALNPDIIPIAGGKKTRARQLSGKPVYKPEEETKNGVDKDGVAWYGEGVQQDNFGAIKPIGKGHFQG